MAICKLLAPLIVDGAEADEEGGGAGGDGLERRGDEGAVMEGGVPHGCTRGSEGCMYAVAASSTIEGRARPPSRAGSWA